MSKVRVEYLCTNIENERKLKWLENAKFMRVIEDHEVVELSFEEYLFRLRKENAKYIDHQKGDITFTKQQEDYQNWKERSQWNIFSLDGSSIRWDNSIVHSLATYLATHPLVLPYFLESNAINIVGLFLGESILFNSMALASQFGYEEFKLWEKQSISERDYCDKNFEAKYKLSLFLGVLDELLDLGVNLSEFSFVDLRKVNTFEETVEAPIWNEKLISTINASTYRRCDGQTFEKQDLLGFIQFQDLETFLDSIMLLVDSEYYVHFIEEAVTMNPKKVVALPYFHTRSMDFIDRKDLVEISGLCKSLKEKLKRVASDSVIKVLRRKIEQIRKRLANNVDKEDIDYSEILKEIEALYQAILASTTDKEILLEFLKQVIDESGLDFSINEKVEPPNPEMKVEDDMASRLKDLERRVGDLENRVSSLELQLLQYIKNGGQVPDINIDSVTREEVIKLILEYKPATFQEKMRKLNVLKLLKVSTMGALLGGLLFISGSSPKVLEHPVSLLPTPTIPIETSISDLPESVPTPVVPSVKPIEELPVDSIPEENEKIILKPLEEIVREVLRGNWGNGQERREALEKEGYDFVLIQSYVNYVKEENVPLNKLRPIEEIIREVANGDWGEGEEMVTRLRTVGFDYDSIKEFVEELKQSENTSSNQYH